MVSSTEKKTTKNSDLCNLSFEQASAELEGIVQSLENGGLELDRAIQLYARGNDLKNHCEKILAEAKLKIDNIVQKNNQIELQPSVE